MTNDERYVLLPWGKDVAELARFVLELCLAESPPVMIRMLDGLHLGALVAAGGIQVIEI